MIMINRLFQQIFGRKPKLENEAFVAYFNKLPDGIQVGWVRDGKFIVGNVKAGNHEFVTQGIGAEDFVEMVNEAVLTVYDIPDRYFNAVKSRHAYNPPIEDMAKLKNHNIQEAFISANKNQEVLELAKN